MIRGLLLAALVCAALPASAQDNDPAVGKVSNLPIPRFVSIKTDEANLRVGPGGQYPVRWRLARAGMPAQVVDEEGQWYEIVLHDGERGWLYRPLLTGRRNLYVTRNRAPIFKEADPSTPIVAYAETGVILRALACAPAWCEVRKGDIDGWIARGDVWGVTEDETFE